MVRSVENEDFTHGILADRTAPAGRSPTSLLRVETTTLKILATMGGSRIRSEGWDSVKTIKYMSQAYLKVQLTQLLSDF